MMDLLKAFVAVGIFLFGLCAIVMGAIVSTVVWTTGVISVNWSDDPSQSRDVSMSAAPQEFWLYFALLGLLPIVAGFAAITWARRIERS